MNPKEQETKPKGLTRREFLRRAGVAALGAAAGLVLPDSLKNTKADGSTGSPLSAPVEEVQYKYRAFIPLVNKEYRENPYLTKEFGAPERGVIMRNRVEEGRSNPAYVEMGDPELFENMMYLREKYGRPDLRLEIYFYGSVSQLEALSGVPLTRSNTRIIPYSTWTDPPGVFAEYSQFRFKKRENGTLEFHITLPEPKAGVIPTALQINGLHIGFMEYLESAVFLTGDNGQPIGLVIRPGSPESIDFRNHPSFVFDNGIVVASAIWIAMKDTNPVEPGK